jgi:capsular polysaccharide biosynthesis protein
VGGTVEFANAAELMIAPDRRWLTVDDAYVQDGGTVTSQGTLVSYEVAADPRLRFVSGVWASNFGSAEHPDGMLLLRRRAAENRMEEGILIGGRNDDNWYHWLAEYLPRVLTIPSDIPADVPVLISSRTPSTGVEALRELTDRPIVTLDSERSQSVGCLHVAPPVVQLLDTGSWDWDTDLALDPEPLDLLRTHWGVTKPREGPGRRIFLHRRSARRAVVNEDELAAIAQRAGLELVDPGALTFAEQRVLYGETELLVSANGAVMANYLMMRPQSDIVALTSEQVSDARLAASLAAVAGCRFRFLVGRSEADFSAITNLNDWIHAAYRIDEEEFARVVGG